MLGLGLSPAAPAMQAKRPGGPAPMLLSLITPVTVIASDTLIQGT